MSTAPPLDDDNLLAEILLRLPPQPSSLPRASLVCRGWRRLASDPGFARRFRLHHRANPPLLGCFVENGRGLSFLPTMEAPNHVPPGRFSLQSHNCSSDLLGCRHGLVLFFDAPRRQVLVWDPVTAHHNRVALPAGFDVAGVNKVQGTVLRAAAAGDDAQQHFQVVLAVADLRDIQQRRALACTYSSTTGLWGNLVSTPVPSKNPTGRRRIIILQGNRGASLVGNSIYCLIDGSFVGLLEFDLERQNLLTVINLPSDVYAERQPCWDLMVMQAEGGGLGLFFLSDLTAQLWKRTTDGDGNASWVLGRTIELGRLFSLNSEKERSYLCILGYAEENNVVFLVTLTAVFMIHLDSLQFKKLSRHNKFSCYHPFESVYAAEACVSAGHDEAGVLLNTSTG